MATAYISSTFNDLKEYRGKVYETLRKLRFDVIAMEDYVATDNRPLNKCLADVKACDIYVGVFAWRYGYIPSEDNPEYKSITHLEYQTAKSENRPCLIFLLDEQASWPPQLMDSYTGENEHGQHINAFRQLLTSDNIVSHFTTPDNLSNLVSISTQKHIQNHLFSEGTTDLYSQLEKYLQANDWKEADKETAALMLKIMGREKEGWLDISSLEDFPAQELKQIDKLWTTTSQGNFGFSMQQEIWKGIEKKHSYDELYSIFGDSVAWRINNEWIGHQDINYTLNAPKGHLPILRGQPILLGLEPPKNHLISVVTAPTLKDAWNRFGAAAEEGLQFGLSIASTFLDVKPSPSCRKRSSVIISIEGLKTLYSRQELQAY